MENDFITIYNIWLKLTDIAFYILLYIRLFSKDGKTLQCDITDIKKYFWLNNTNTEMYQEIENLKQCQYISYIKGRRKKDYTLIINDDFMKKLVDRDVRETKRYYEKIDKYIDIEHYRESLVISKVRKQNIDIILHFNRDIKGKPINKNMPSASPIITIKLYIFACAYSQDYKISDCITYKQLADIFGIPVKPNVKDRGSGIENASALLKNISLVKQLYCKEVLKNEKEEQEQKRIIAEARAKGKEIKQKFIPPLGTIHYINNSIF